MTPLVCAVPVKAESPSLQDNTADYDRLQQALVKHLADDRSLYLPFSRIVPVTRRFREAGFSGYALLNRLQDQWVVADFLAAEPEVIAGMALDLGTTHLEATLIDLQTGQMLAENNLENSQIRFGADILSRIHHATTKRRQLRKPDADFLDPGLQELQQTIVETVNELTGKLAESSGIQACDIRALAVSGNTTMAHLLLGVDPYHICREPYIPLFNRVPDIEASQLDLVIHGAAPVWVMPSVGSYFGGDLISGILASGMAQSSATRMLIDVGTNAEVVLGNSEWLIACAGAAGPALEGGVARMGMRAGPGAIEFVSIDPDTFTMEYRTIADAPALGICGSGLIDLVAALYLCRLIDIRGKIRDPAKEKDPLRLAFMQEHILEHEGKRVFRVTGASASAKGREVLLEQIDLDAMMRSKAAMYAILTTLVNQVGLEFTDLEEIIVAGAFGRHINPEKAITLGMLPDLPLNTYRAIGNSSLRGAERVLLDGDARLACEKIVSGITYLELNVNQEFMLRFSGSRFIPHTDTALFPSVPNFHSKS